MCGIWSWSGWCAGLGVVGVRDLELEWVVCGIWSGWCAGLGVGVGGVRDLELEWVVCGIWSWSGWCAGLLGDLRGWVVCAGLGLDGVWD